MSTKETEKTRKFTTAIGVSPERVEEIAEMVTQTITTAFDSVVGSIATGEYKSLFDNAEKLQLEDIKLLRSVQEGIVYGFATAEAIDAVKDVLKESSGELALLGLPSADCCEVRLGLLGNEDVEK